MNRLFSRFRSRAPDVTTAIPDALPGFDDRVSALRSHAQQAARYEDDLLSVQRDVNDQLQMCEALIEQALQIGEDAEALEYVRLAARLRPQYELLEKELRAFGSVADILIQRLDLLLNNLDEARTFARSAELNSHATEYLDEALTRLTRYFIMLDRVASVRRRELPDRLADLMNQVLDDRHLDLMLASYILDRRRALDSGQA